MSTIDTVTDELGADVEFAGPIDRVVSLVPSLSEALWWFGAADRVVGVTEYCTAPPQGFPAATRIRGTKNPDVDAIVGLEPDLVVANEEENRAMDVERLRDAGVAVYVTSPRTVEAAAGTLERLGELVGAAGPARDLATRIRRSLAGARARRPDPPLRTFCAVWRDPWMAVGADTYAADLLRVCGYEVVPTVPGDDRYPRVSLEQVRAADPQVVLLPDEPYAFGERDRKAFDGWASRVRLADGTQLTWYGPRTPYALDELSRRARTLARRRSRV